MSLGICVNEDKSALVSLQELTFIGVRLTCLVAWAFLPADCFAALTSVIAQLCHHPHTSQTVPFSPRPYDSLQLCHPTCMSAHMMSPTVAAYHLPSATGPPPQKGTFPPRSLDFPRMVVQLGQGYGQHSIQPSHTQYHPHHGHFAWRLGCSSGGPYCPRTMVPQRGQNADQHPGITSSPLLLSGIPTLLPIPSCTTSLGQQGGCHLYKQTGWSPVPNPLSKSIHLWN